MKRNVLLGVFLAGILFIGVGAGITFAEYSSFQYGGEIVIGKGGTEVDTEIYTIPLDQKTFICNGTSEGTKMVEDKSLKDGQVRIEILYNSKYTLPYFEYEYEPMEEEILDGYQNSFIHIHTHQSIGEFEMFMECKDDFLTNLKKHILKSYQLDPVESVTVKANAVTMQFLEY